MSPKEAVIEMIRQMPDGATTSDILYAVYVRNEVEEGLRELDAGEGIPHDEAMQRLKRWLG